MAQGFTREQTFEAAGVLDDLTDVTTAAEAEHQVLYYDAVAGQWVNGLLPEVWPFCMSGTVTLITDATALRLMFPYAVNIVGCRAVCSVAPTGADLIVDVHLDGTTVYTVQANRPTITAAGFDSGSWAVPAVTAVPVDSYLTVNVDQIGSTIPGAGLTVMVKVTRGA